MNNETLVEVWRFETGTQGRVDLMGTLKAPLVTVQLLESPRGLVSGTPKIRVAQFVSINGTLREVGERYDQISVTLAGGEELPSAGDHWIPIED